MFAYPEKPLFALAGLTLLRRGWRVHQSTEARMKPTRRSRNSRGACKRMARSSRKTAVFRYTYEVQKGGRFMRCGEGENKCTLLFPCEWEKEEWNGSPVKIGAPNT